jgi:hypothetical protein
LAALLSAATLISCYEAGSRKGPLASTLDSLIPRHEPVHCINIDELLPRQPKHHICLVVGDTSRSYSVGKSGRILDVVKNLPMDAGGSSRLQEIRDGLTRSLGRPDYEGDDGHGNQVHRWATDSTCVSLHEEASRTFAQLSYRTPDFLGPCRK